MFQRQELLGVIENFDVASHMLSKQAKRQPFLLHTSFLLEFVQKKHMHATQIFCTDT